MGCRVQMGIQTPTNRRHRKRRWGLKPHYTRERGVPSSFQGIPYTLHPTPHTQERSDDKVAPGAEELQVQREKE